MVPKAEKGYHPKLSPFAWDHMDPKSRQRDFSTNFCDLLQKINHGFFFSHGYNGQVCVSRLIWLASTIPFHSDFIMIYFGYLGPYGPKSRDRVTSKNYLPLLGTIWTPKAE